MVEASQIDDYGHANQLDPLVEEILDFDRTIGKYSNGRLLTEKHSLS